MYIVHFFGRVMHILLALVVLLGYTALCFFPRVFTWCFEWLCRLAGVFLLYVCVRLIARQSVADIIYWSMVMSIPLILWVYGLIKTRASQNGSAF